MSQPIPDLPAACSHGLRPGTTVCLHCLREKRLAARRQRYRVAARIGLATTGGSVAAALIIGAIMSITPGSRGSQQAVAATPTTVAATPRRTPRAGLQPAIAMGRTELGDGVFAERSGDSVVVHFDTDSLRTRFDWKFEGVVRRTLPSVFPQSQAPLNGIPQATLARGVDLLRDLPRTGIRLSVDPTHALTIWPITRPGQDGPLVVAYRVSASR